MTATTPRTAGRSGRVAVPGARKRSTQGLRNMELLLLAFAVGIVFSAILLVQLGVRGSFDVNVITLAGLVAILMLGIHIVLRFRAPQADPFILPIATVLNGLGIAMIYRIDLADSANEGVFFTASTSQIILTGVGAAAAIVTLLFLKNHRVLQRYTYTFMVAAIVLLILPLVPGLAADANAKVWISVAGFSFQPGEIAKICLAIFFAGYLVTARESLESVGPKVLGIRFPRMKDLGPIVVVWLACMAVLVFQRDLGTSLLYFGLFLVMMYVATARISWVVIGGGLFLVGGFLAAQVLDYVHFRVRTWLDPFSPDMYEADGGSYQLVQGLFGFANGGLLGQGLGQGRPDITPLASSDFILSAVGEELGLSGVFVVLALFVILVARGFRIGHQGLDDFGRLLATGLAFIIALQVFVVAGGVLRVIPLTGLTLPFMASGGSSLLANWIIVAILLRLSDTVRADREVSA
ncbi:putative FtsW-like protein [Pseudoclavibacter triregionum]|nr:putative FtsW-like protein [Pseudoclavibacter triregionum]